MLALFNSVSVISVLDVGALTAAATVAWATGFTVLGDILVNNTTAGYGAASVLLPTNGWTNRVATTGLGTITACDPTKMSISVTDLGWAVNGSQTSRNRTITGVARLSKGNPDYTFTDLDQASGVVELTLDQQIYNDPVIDISGRLYKTIINSVSFLTGFINGSSAAGFLPGTITPTRNDSYTYPKPIVACVDYPNQRMDSSNAILLEWSTIHEFAQQNSQLACVESWVRQSGVDGAVTRASAMTESRWTSSGSPPSGFHQPIFSTSVSGGSFADGPATVRATFKPWIGPCMNTFDTGIGDTGVSQNLLADWPFVRDVSAGKYSPLYAWVLYDGTGTATGTAGVSASATDPGTAASANYATMVAAETALRTANNAAGFRGSNIHNDTAGGVIMLRDVTGSVAGANFGCYSIRTSMGNTPGAIPLEIRGAAGVTSQLCRMRGINSDGTAVAQKGMAKNVKFTNIYFDSKGTADTSAANMIWDASSGAPSTPLSTWQLSLYHIFQDCYMEENSYTPASLGNMFIRTSLRWDYRVKEAVYIGSPGIFSNFAGTVVSIGSHYTGSGLTTHSQGAFLASYGRAMQLTPQSSAILTTPTTKMILIYNSRLDMSFNIAGSTGFNGNRTRTQQNLGIGFCGFLIWRGGTAGASNYSIDADAQMGACRNVVLQHFATPSGTDTNYRANTRGNACYNETGGVLIRKEASHKYCFFAASANKEGGFGSGLTNAGLGASAFSAAVQYYQGDIVWDPLSGVNTVTSSTIYGIMKDTLGGALTDTTTFKNFGIMGSTTWGARPLRTGNHRWRYMVGCYGSFNGGDVNGTGNHVPGLLTWLTNVYCPGTPGTGWGNVDVTTGLFQNDTCGPTSTLATPGDYRPLVGSILRNMVPIGLAVDPFDMLGTVRPNNGSGAAGALEYS